MCSQQRSLNGHGPARQGTGATNPLCTVQTSAGRTQEAGPQRSAALRSVESKARMLRPHPRQGTLRSGRACATSAAAAGTARRRVPPRQAAPRPCPRPAQRRAGGRMGECQGEACRRQGSLAESTSADAAATDDCLCDCSTHAATRAGRGRPAERRARFRVSASTEVRAARSIGRANEANENAHTSRRRCSPSYTSSSPAATPPPSASSACSRASAARTSNSSCAKRTWMQATKVRWRDFLQARREQQGWQGLGASAHTATVAASCRCRPPPPSPTDLRLLLSPALLKRFGGHRQPALARAVQRCHRRGQVSGQPAGRR